MNSKEIERDIIHRLNLRGKHNIRWVPVEFLGKFSSQLPVPEIEAVGHEVARHLCYYPETIKVENGRT